MPNQFSRSELIYGKDAIELLKHKHVAIFGLGGVGGYVAESLARTGIGRFTLIDGDTIALTNLNRQIIATLDTVGKYKSEVMRDRILSINPDAKIEALNIFVDKDNIKNIDFDSFDYIVDAIDTVTSKIAIIVKAKELNKPIISSMGAGNKVNSMGFIVADISKTEMDPLAKVIRTSLRKQEINHLKVVYSKEVPLKPISNGDVEESNKREIPGSNAFVPSAAGLLIASEVIRDLTNEVTREELHRE